MKKILFLFVLLPVMAISQATTGYHRVSQVFTKSSSNTTAMVVPYAKITVTGTGSGTSATIYSDPILTSQISPSMVTADGSGNYSYYIPLNYCVNETVSSPGMGTYTTQNICALEAFQRLTTTGTSGVATLSGGILNIPNYTYTLPIATTSTLGGIKPDGVTCTVAGVTGILTCGGGSAASITVGTTTVSSGTSGYILYDNAGTLGNLATTGTGSVVLLKFPVYSDVGNANLIFGSSFSSNTTGNGNVANGNAALYANTTGSYNTANGDNALYANTTGSYNTANGDNALYANTTGNSNIAIGLQSGWYLADGTTGNINSSNSVFEGNFTKAAAASDTNEIVIGYSAIGAGSNTAVIGNSSVTDVYLGSASANASLHAGGITDSGLTTAGYVTNNASGALGTVATIPYSALSGTVPTWNQNTTGTAANITATSNSTLTTLSALSLPYSQLTGTPSTSTTVNGQTCTLGSSCTVTASASGITVGTTTVSGSTTGHVLYNNGGTLGDIATTGSGSVVLSSTLGSYLPLSGGTLTGGLTGTTANFTGNTTFGTSGAGNTIDLYGTVTVRPQAAATSLTNYNSNNLYIAGSYYSTSTSQPISSDWEFTNIVGSGSSPTSVLTIANADTNETRSISMLYPVTVASLSNSNGVVIPLSTTGYTGSGNVVLSSTLGSYLPLSGGSLTGALSGTTASFTGAVTLGGTISAMVHYLGFSDMSNSVYSSSAAVSWLLSPVNMTLYNTVTAVGVSCTSQARLLHAATASTTFNLDYDGVSFGTVTFAASSSIGTFSWSSGLSVAAGNAYEVYAPSTADATAAGLSLTICATY